MAGDKEIKKSNGRRYEVRLPGSTSNLGAGFDCFGLALQLYLTVRATVTPEAKTKCRVRTAGIKEAFELPRTAENLVYRAMAYAAQVEGLKLPPLRLSVVTRIPLGRGLGSSAAAIVGGVKLASLVSGAEMSNEKILEYATRFEGHPDNVSAALFGGFVVTCLAHDGAVIALKQPWPSDLNIVLVSPHFRVATKLAREALPRVVTRADAVANLQRSALFVTALAERRYDLLWEGMRDHLHQERRQSLVPGLGDVLALPQKEGLLGIALSGAGPSVLAVATANHEQIAELIAECFRRHRINTSWQRLEVDQEGCRVVKNN
jgi:homoserine kinase